jgi:hypothetical protein
LRPGFFAIFPARVRLRKSSERWVERGFDTIGAIITETAILVHVRDGGGEICGLRGSPPVQTGYMGDEKSGDMGDGEN